MRLAGLFKGSFRRSLIFTFLIAFALLLTYAVLPASAQEGDGMYGGNSAPETHAEHAASLRYAKKVPLATCTEGQLPPGSGEDLEVTTGTCHVKAGLYKYRNVNIYKGGELLFDDTGSTDFWAASIIVERDGSLVAGSAQQPYGVNGTLTIHLWGAQQGTGQGQGVAAPCKYDDHCGVPIDLWDSNTMSQINPSSCTHAIDVQNWKQNLPGNVDDCFYQYMPLTYDTGGTPPGYFGYKVLGVSFGGTLQLFGIKGSTRDPQLASNSGISWARLTQTLKGKRVTLETTFTLDRKVNWKKGDEIVLSPTDYVASHAEVLTLAADAEEQGTGSLITVVRGPFFGHYGEVYPLPPASELHGTGPDQTSVDTRAAVGLLSRSIRIVSAKDEIGQDFPPEPEDGKPGYFFGGHVIFRQGFESVQVRGVEFYQLGQGGRIMHYPVHFHMVRQAPQGKMPHMPATFIEDSSVWDSMTRWIVLHATNGVTLARNVGYKSIGHGYYLEDATETNNQFYSNLGVLARAAVINPQNLRQVPGILAAAYPDPANCGDDCAQEEVPLHTDVDHPTDFWITNTWNDFKYNYAAGAGTCGACYWFVPAANSTMSRYEYWWGYSSEQKWNPTPSVADSALARVAMAPIESFEGNQCSTAMNSLNTIGDTAPCFGVVKQGNPNLPRMPAVNNALAPAKTQPEADNYYPKVDRGGGHFPTECPSGEFADCSTQPRCDSGHLGVCDATVINHYTTSFNFPEYNFAAVWLRPQWYLFSNSAVTDVQNGGLTFVTGGGYTLSDAIQGHWAIARNDVFVGHTQPPAGPNLTGGNPYADESGPFNPITKAQGLTCAKQPDGGFAGNFCLDSKQGMIMLLTNFGNNQRFFNIYDGPAFEENNAYLDIKPVTITGCSPGGNCSQSDWMYGQVSGVTKDPEGKCYLPNAAIGWKQPNGFYYPPAFHSNNLFFKNTEIRHFVIEPLFEPNTYKTVSTAQLDKRYCTYNAIQFSGYTDIDRQTELDDDDGSLTGLVGTISVNKDPFFNAPVEDTECASDIKSNMPPACDPNSPTCATAKTSPYAFLSTVVYPDCGPDCPKLPDPKSPDWMHWWTRDCATPQCFGVPLYREFLRKGESGKPYIRMAGQAIAQRSTLTLNNGTYFMDTTPSSQVQHEWSGNIDNQYRGNQFMGDHWYYVFLLYAKPGDADGKLLPDTTKQTYRIWVGPNFDKTQDVKAIQIKVDSPPFAPDVEGDAAIPPDHFDVGYEDNILSVTFDTNFSEFRKNYLATAKGKCQPQNLCSWNDSGGSCGCKLSQQDPLYGQCQAVCSKWTQSDVDCPQGGCYGFMFHLDANFKPENQAQIPTPACLTKDSPGWNIPFDPAKAGLAGSCYYKDTPPSGQFCNQE
jgi:cell migration-inducing and hyaluronan-binding protein